MLILLLPWQENSQPADNCSLEFTIFKKKVGNGGGEGGGMVLNH